MINILQDDELDIVCGGEAITYTTKDGVTFADGIGLSNNSVIKLWELDNILSVGTNQKEWAPFAGWYAGNFGNNGATVGSLCDLLGSGKAYVGEDSFIQENDG